MARVPAFAQAFKGRWRIVEMDIFADDDLDLLEPAHITFEGKNGGAFVFCAVTGDLDVRYGSRDGAGCAEFSWQGFNDEDPASGRGWAMMGTSGRLIGHIFFHDGDDTGFIAEGD